MPTKKTTQKAKKALRGGKSPSTAAGEFVHEEIEHIRKGKHGAKNARQAIAIGLSKARRAGVPVKPKSGSTGTKKKATRELARAGRKPNPKRARATEKALQRQPKRAASHAALSRAAKKAAVRRRRAGGSNTPKATARRAAATRRRRAAAD
ncbi:MAG: transcription elongation factor [Polyangiales bacterium]